jgi:hypothetical protein
MSCAGVDLQHDLVIDALFGLAVEALFTLGIAVARSRRIWLTTSAIVALPRSWHL